MAHDVSALEGKLRKLDQSLAALAATKHAQQLIPVIHRPGWTTVAEMHLVHAMVDHLQAQLDGLHRAHEALLTAAHQVGAP